MQILILDFYAKYDLMLIDINHIRMVRILRNGRIIRVGFDFDPTWTTEDKWMSCNLFAKFVNMSYTVEQATSYASAAVWKNKWKGTKYDTNVENVLEKTQV
jgi:hypothetical protein